MKHINRIVSIILVLSSILTIGGCGKKEAYVTDDVIHIASNYNMIPSKVVTDNNTFFAENLCVIDTNDIGVNTVSSELIEAAGLFNLDQQTVSYAQDIHGKIYPASTTKIMTCLIILENVENLDEVTTVSANCVENYPTDSSMQGLKTGDIISIRNLLYGLMLPSGNDSATCLAEYYSGSEEAFAEVMNKRALELGCTNTHFVNPHGLHDDNHYTSTYDMYLIFNEAIKHDLFMDLISAKSKKITYTDKNGKGVSKELFTSNRFISTYNKITPPKNVTVIGGKTGTTEQAGYCLALLSTNNNGDKVISIVYNANCRANLYYLHQQILGQYADK